MSHEVDTHPMATREGESESVWQQARPSQPPQAASFHQGRWRDTEGEARHNGSWQAKERMDRT